MGLVSSIYGMAPSEAFTPEERELRVKAALRLLIEKHGLASVLSKLATGPGDREVRAALYHTALGITTNTQTS